MLPEEVVVLHGQPGPTHTLEHRVPEQETETEVANPLEVVDVEYVESVGLLTVEEVLDVEVPNDPEPELKGVDKESEVELCDVNGKVFVEGVVKLRLDEGDPVAEIDCDDEIEETVEAVEVADGGVMLIRVVRLPGILELEVVEVVELEAEDAALLWLEADDPSDELDIGVLDETVELVLVFEDGRLEEVELDEVVKAGVEVVGGDWLVDDAESDIGELDETEELVLVDVEDGEVDDTKPDEVGEAEADVELNIGVLDETVEVVPVVESGKVGEKEPDEVGGAAGEDWLVDDVELDIGVLDENVVPVDPEDARLEETELDEAGEAEGADVVEDSLLEEVELEVDTVAPPFELVDVAEICEIKGLEDNDDDKVAEIEGLPEPVSDWLVDTEFVGLIRVVESKDELWEEVGEAEDMSELAIEF
ncbi:MAG: hypothetical protein Q9221_003243 [Calogaya cf. arnoldii]